MTLLHFLAMVHCEFEFDPPGVGSLEKWIICKADFDVLSDSEPISHILHLSWSLLHINVFYWKSL